MNPILRISAVATMIAASYPAMAGRPDAPLEQPEISVAGYNCCAPTCGAGADGCCDPSCGCGGGDGCGRDCCVATVERVKVEKHCWCTETKKVCVPKVVCPWAPGGSGLTIFNFLHKKNGGCGDVCCGDGCSGGGCCGGDGECCGHGCGCFKPRCGKVVCVKDLVKKKYECEECVCKWEVRRLPPCCGCCDGGCGECGDGCCSPVE